MAIEERTGTFRAAITAAFPELSSSTFKLLTTGWDSTAVDVDDRLIFKFPRHEVAEKALRREADLLSVIRPAVTMPVPDLTLHPGPPLFSRHEKLKGEHLVTARYGRLPEPARGRLAEQMALFYAELHRLDPRVMEAAGAGPLAAWLPPEETLDNALPVLPPLFAPLPNAPFRRGGIFRRTPTERRTASSVAMAGTGPSTPPAGS